MTCEEQMLQLSLLSAGFLRATGKLNVEAAVHWGWVKGKSSSNQDKSAKPRSIGHRRSSPATQMARGI